MINPDLIYMLHEQRDQKLWAEAKQLRVQRALASGRPTRSRSWLVIWLRCLVIRRLRDVTVTQ
jgi:hypothetical protein